MRRKRIFYRVPGCRVDGGWRFPVIYRRSFGAIRPKALLVANTLNTQPSKLLDYLIKDGMSTMHGQGLERWAS